jgi:VWFA-related protein
MNANGNSRARSRANRTRANGGWAMQSMRTVAAMLAGGVILLGSAPVCLETRAAAQSAKAETANTVPPFTVLHANANLVLVDVVVDDHGKPVEGLPQSAFRILEDSREQSIFSFEEHGTSGDAGTAAADASAQPQSELPPGTYTNLPAYPEQGAVDVLLLDGLNTQVTDQMRVRKAMIEYMGKIKPGTTMAVFTLGLQLRMVSGFTSNVAELAMALTNPKANVQPSALLNEPSSTTGTTAGSDAQTDQVVSAIQQAQPPQPTSVGNAGPGGAASGPMNATQAIEQFEADQVTAQTDMQVRTTLDALKQLAVYLSGIPGRKNLIWLSGSFPFAILPDSSLYSGFRAMSSYRDQVAKTCDLLTQARVAVYPVGAAGLWTPAVYNAANGTAPKNQALGTALINEREQADEVEGSMEEIATDTGGHAYKEMNDLDQAVADSIENGSHYYTIGYVPAAAELNGQFRKIQVRVEGRDYKLAYRRGYYADPPDAPSAHGTGRIPPLVAAALHGAPPATQIVFKAGLLNGSDPLLQNVRLPEGPAGEMSKALAKPERYVVNLTLNPRSLNLDMSPDGTRQAKIELALIGYDADGNVANFVDKRVALGLQAAQYAQIQARGIPLLVPIDLPAGDDSVRIAVEDLTAARTGSLEIPVTVTAH